MMLRELIPDAPAGIHVNGLCDDSRHVKPGDLFCAVVGEQFDGRAYAADALKRGAVAILSEPPAPDLSGEQAAVPVIEVENLAGQLGPLASQYFEVPSEKLQVIAVTGTNGKTSFTQMMSQALNSKAGLAGLIGTMGHGVPGELRDPGLTTPAAIDLQRRLKELLEQGCDSVVLEASSHGLVQERLAGTQVDVAVLTNITHDHLDYHGSFAAYREAKSRLFTMASLRTAIINQSDEYASELIGLIDDGVNVVTYAVDRSDADVFARELTYSSSGISATISLGDLSLDVTVPLFGKFNVENLLAVVAVLHSLEWTANEIQRAVESLTPVTGRMQWISAAGMPTVLIDYAHTPDALEKALLAARKHFSNANIQIVFGCGGDRDKAKRSMMGEIASRLADQVVVTSDNPRSEDPQAILREIEAGVSNGNVRTIEDRKAAILEAIDNAASSSVVLIAGKGHEDYQELAEGRIAFSDVDVVHEGFARRAANLADGAADGEES